MVFRNLVIALTYCLTAADVDVLIDKAFQLNTSGKLANKDYDAFADIAARFRLFMR